MTSYDGPTGRQRALLARVLCAKVGIAYPETRQEARQLIAELIDETGYEVAYDRPAEHAPSVRRTRGRRPRPRRRRSAASAPTTSPTSAAGDEPNPRHDLARQAAQEARERVERERSGASAEPSSRPTV